MTSRSEGFTQKLPTPPPYKAIPGDFSFPGSKGQVIVTRILGDDVQTTAYNVAFTGSDGKEHEFATINSTSSSDDKASLGVPSPKWNNVLYYRPNTYPISDDPENQLLSQELAGELLVALNFLYKPSRGQTTRSKWDNVPTPQQEPS